MVAVLEMLTVNESLIVFIGNYSIPVSQGPTLPILDWIPINSPLVGSFLAIIVSVTIAMITIWRTGNSNRKYIKAVSKASTDQIKEMRYWRDLKRKQQIKFLVQELIDNVKIYNRVSKRVEKENYNGIFFNFSLVTIERCLIDTPIDDNAINLNLSIIYHMFKTHDNLINGTRGGLYTEESLKNFIQAIAKDYIANQEFINNLISSLNIYEQNIKLYPLVKLDGYE